MIKEIREYGSTSAISTDYMYYNIELKWDSKGKEYSETFSGTEQGEVLQNAMKFIIKHYKKSI